MKHDVYIIGQGVTGLVAALRLSQQGYRVTMIDAAPQGGGLSADLPLADETIERIYHHAFASDTYLANLYTELGLRDSLHWYTPKNGLLADKTLYPFTTPFDLLRFAAIPFGDRIKTGLTVLRAKNVKDWQALEAETASDYLQKHAGQKAYERLWRPLLRAKFGDDAATVSAVWIWNKFKLRGASRDKSLKDERLAYPDGGFGRLVAALRQRLEKNGVQFKNEERVRQIRIGEGREPHTIITDNGTYRTSKLIAAVAAPVFQAFLAADKTMEAELPLPSEAAQRYLAKLEKTKYKANICFLLAFRERVTPYYWTTVCDDAPYVVIVEHTNMVEAARYGRHLVYLSLYLDANDATWQYNDAELETRFTEALFRQFPEAKAHYEGVVALTRSRYAQPVIPKHYSESLPAMKTPWHGVYLAGMSQIYPEDRGLNYAVRLGQDVAEALLLS